MCEASCLIAYEVFKNLPLEKREIETPICKTEAGFLKNKNPVLIPILRAGNGFLEGFLRIVPTAKVGHIGLYRDPNSEGTVVEYYSKFPEDIASRDAIVLDPLLATGNSASAALSRLKLAKPKSITFVTLLSSPEGLEYVFFSTPRG